MNPFWPIPLLLRAWRSDRHAIVANRLWLTLDLPDDTLPTAQNYQEAVEAGEWNRALTIARLVVHCAEHSSLWTWSGGPLDNAELVAWRKRRETARRRARRQR